MNIQTSKGGVMSRISRREFFIGGAASAFGAFGGTRLFAAAVPSVGGAPRLRIGVLSDIHIRVAENPGKAMWGDPRTFKHALKWFRGENVDAVVISGDLTDNGMVEQLQAVADAWYSVFPEDRYPDGRPVKKVFVMGNHDYHGYLYGDHAAKAYPDEAERAKHVLRADFSAHWKRIFNEDYEPFYSKSINGYTFLCEHWDDGKGMETGLGAVNGSIGSRLRDFLGAHGRTLDLSLPFFYVQHPHPKDTCYGPWAWGHDTGIATKALSAFPNAIAISGHSHYSLTDERSVWQGEFTSVGASSLYTMGMPYNECLPAGYENTRTTSWMHDAGKMMGEFFRNDCRQGMLWSVYDDCIVVRRREFNSDLDLGDDWVIPLPAAESKPFAFAERAKKSREPVFPEGAAPVVTRIKAKNRGGSSRDGTKRVESVERDAFKIVVPAAVVDKDARLYKLEFAAVAKDGTQKTKLVLAEGYDHAPSHAKASSPSFCVFALDELPAGEVRFSVTPINCWDRRGKPIMSDPVVV